MIEYSISPIRPKLICPNVTDSGEHGEGENLSDANPNSEEGTVVMPREPNQPEVPTVEEYIKHQITHYPTKPWCPTCVKNAAQNNPHHKNKNQR